MFILFYVCLLLFFFSLIKIAATNEAEGTRMSEILSAFLAKEYHLKQARGQPNIVQALLESVERCYNPPGIQISANPVQFAPKFSPALLKFLAKSFNAWMIVVKMLSSKKETAKEEMKVLCKFKLKERERERKKERERERERETKREF